jgi:hypothetical protein
MTEAIRSRLTSDQLSGLVVDLEAARTNRELAPQRMFIELVTKVLEKAGTPAAPPASSPERDRMIDFLTKELEATRAEMRQARPAASGDGIQGLTALTATVKGVMEAGELLGMKRGGSPAAATAASLWSPDSVKTMLEGFAPVAGRIMDLVDYKLSGGALRAPGGADVKPSPEAAALQQRAIEQARAAEQAMREQVDFLLEALRTQDFATVYWMLTNAFVREDGEPLVAIDPDVNPLAYVLKLKPIAPKINELRSEVALFLKWVGERRAEEAAAEQARKT